MAREKAPVDGNEKTQRRVYVLPNELVERIVEFQTELGLASEVEAARRLLDDALKRRDTILVIAARLIAQYHKVRSFRDAAKEILVDHPLVNTLGFDLLSLRFSMVDGLSAEISNLGVATIKNEEGYIIDYGENTPKWLSSDHPRPRPKPKAGGRMNDVIDDDIPF